MRSLLFFVLTFLSVNLAFAADLDCRRQDLGGTEIRFCLSQPAVPSDTLLVYLHGLGGNERQYYDLDVFRDIHRHLQALGKEPTVITISFGQAWLLTEVPGSKMLFSKVMDQFLPAMEKSLQPSGFQHKILLGMSMGGFNGSQILLKRPEAFEKVLLLCPAITAIGPQATDEEVSDYIKRTGAESYRVRLVQAFTKREFPTLEDWNAHAPLTLAQKAGALPAVYLSCGLNDQYGFQEGALMMFNLVQPKARTSTWIPIPNAGHCAIDPVSVTNFIAQ